MVQQTPWIERSFQFDFPPGLFPVIFSRLEGSIFRLFHLLANAGDEFCSHHPGSWSVKEHLGHLTDLETLWWNRLKDFRENKPVLTAADMNNSRTYEALHNEKSLESLLNAFVVERQKMLETIYEFDEEMLGRTALHPRLNQPMRVIDALYFVAEHDDHHITIISSMLRKPAV
ncbi:MAG: DinB family protein [Flavisolibacter sp.]